MEEVYSHLVLVLLDFLDVKIISDETILRSFESCHTILKKEETNNYLPSSMASFSKVTVFQDMCDFQ